MKKLISILLAVLMVFSLVTVAFAADESADAPTTENTENDATAKDEEGEGSVIPDLGEYDWILDLPFWTVGPALKFAKIALKLVTVYLKVAKIFGLVEKDLDDYIIDLLKGMIKNAENGGTDEPATTAPGTSDALPDAA